MADDKKESRSKNWTIILYPESTPDNWKDIIDEWHIEYVISPLHDKDIDGNGNAKKPHYHLLLMFGGLKAYEQVLDLIQELNCPIPKRVLNSKSLVRYMAHLDDPDKYQYDFNEIQARGGVDLNSLLKPTSAERYLLLKEMMQHIKTESITEYYIFSDYCYQERFEDWFPLLCDNSSIVITSYINSLRHSKKTPSVDQVTGEIFR